MIMYYLLYEHIARSRWHIVFVFNTAIFAFHLFEVPNCPASVFSQCVQLGPQFSLSGETVDKILGIKANLDSVHLAPSIEPDPDDIAMVEKEEENEEDKTE